jgi:hypothetical protein
VTPVRLISVSVGRPGHDVRDARPDLLHAARAPVRLPGRRTEDVAHHPLTVLPLLDALLGDPGTIRSGVVGGTAAGVITAGAHNLKGT